MIIRLMQDSDLEELRKIHEKHYASEFDFPDFCSNFISAFAVVDDEDHIISAGGVRAIAESVIITNKDFSVKDRRTALLLMLQASLSSTGNNQLHAFVQDEKWAKILERYGFRSCKGKALYIG